MDDDPFHDGAMRLEGVVDAIARAWASVGRRAAARLIDFAIGVAMFAGSIFLLALAAGRPENGTGVLLVSIGVTFVACLLY